MSTLSKRPIYTKSQLSQWLTLIDLSKSPMSLEDLEADIKWDPLGALSRIQLWQLAAVPFGNIALHYSPHHTVSLNTETLFTKIVKRKLGGYCMENNLFFATVLRSLGFDLYTTGARVSYALDNPRKDPEDYGGWNHMVNIVTVNGRKYMVDVGFGASGPSQPLHLGGTEFVPNVPTTEGRLAHRAIGPHTDSGQRMWVYEVRNSTECPWIAQYCFSELEFLPEDFTVMNFYTSQSRTSWFTQRLVMAKFLLNEEQTKPVGNLTLSGNKFKKRLHGQGEILMACETEEQRVQALEKYFDIKLHPDEIGGIQGLPSEIK